MPRFVAMAFFALASTLVAAPVAADEGDDDSLSPFHVSIDVAWVRAKVRFFSTSDVLPTCFEEVCGPEGFDTAMMRGAIGLGIGGLTLEATMAKAMETDFEHYVWSAGLRLDTSYRGVVSLMIRGAYIERWGEIGGRGGRFGAGLQLRFIRQIVLYAEGSVDITTVSESMGNQGALFSYATYIAVGMRTVFAR